ncbi:MAG: hypothetical protein KGS47_14855 [Chloroflexi bacterium]|nr:hypothetical protein [Chloroflexota bacterium]
MTPDQLISAIMGTYAGLVVKPAWGESSLFYNPAGALAHGIYFMTVKQRDGAHDSASWLDRTGVFRVSFGLTTATYQRIFGARPPRSRRGQVVATGHDFSAIDRLMPHPVYAWMGWVQVLSPTAETFGVLQPLITEAYHVATCRYADRLAQLQQPRPARCDRQARR